MLFRRRIMEEKGKDSSLIREKKRRREEGGDVENGKREKETRSLRKCTELKMGR